MRDILRMEISKDIPGGKKKGEKEVRHTQKNEQSKAMREDIWTCTAKYQWYHPVHIYSVNSQIFKTLVFIFYK